MMQVKVVTPTEIVFATEVIKIVADGDEGNFCLLPGHVNYLSALVPGILTLTLPNKTEQHLALDSGLLVKTGSEVLISSRHAAIGPELSELRATVIGQYQQLDELERHARSELAKLEANFVRRFIDHQKI